MLGEITRANSFIWPANGRLFLLALKGLSPVLRLETLFGDYAATREVTAQLARGAQILREGGSRNSTQFGNGR